MPILGTYLPLKSIWCADDECTLSSLHVQGATAVVEGGENAPGGSAIGCGVWSMELKRGAMIFFRINLAVILTASE